MPSTAYTPVTVTVPGSPTGLSITLYKEQWLKLLDVSDDILAFVAANEGTLKAKGSR